MNTAKTVKIHVSYDGTRYKGWQKLGDTDKTVQGKLETLLSRICGEPIALNGSGRTDAGVHALNQCASFQTTSALSPLEIQAEANRFLPEDIAVLEAVEEIPRFHARYNARAKTYLYRILNSSVPDPFMRNFNWRVDTPLDKGKMESAAAMLIGEHDFQSFTALKPGKKSTVRHIHAITIQQNTNRFEIRITANGFLHNMARLIVGTLVEVGTGRLAPREVQTILGARKRSLAGPLAPPQGLYLERVEYNDASDKGSGQPEAVPGSPAG